MKEFAFEYAYAVVPNGLSPLWKGLTKSIADGRARFVNPDDDEPVESGAKIYKQGASEWQWNCKVTFERACLDEDDNQFTEVPSGASFLHSRDLSFSVYFAYFQARVLVS